MSEAGDGADMDPGEEQPGGHMVADIVQANAGDAGGSAELTDLMFVVRDAVEAIEAADLADAGRALR